MYADVIVDISHEALDRVFQYRVPPDILNDIVIGSAVRFPFGKGNRIIWGYVIGLSEKSSYPEGKIKNLIGLKEGAVSVESGLIALAAWLRHTYGSTMLQALKTVIPIKQEVRHKENKTVVLSCDSETAWEALRVSIKRKYKAQERLLSELIEEKTLPYELVTQKLNISAQTLKTLESSKIITIQSDIKYRNPAAGVHYAGYEGKTLTVAQDYIVKQILKDYNNNILKPCLIHGVTGSGKTEIYMELAAGMLKASKQSIILIPEIALTYQTIIRFYKRFGNRVSIIHSRMSQGEKYDQFERAKNGEIDIIIGPRSALFTPFMQLGLIVIDEEHEGTYKSETAPRYHARDVAIKRAEIAGALVVMGSATPSVDTYYKAKNGEYRLYPLAERINKNPLPEVSVVDLREELKSGNRSIFSEKLKEGIEQRLADGEQVMLFINRRGYARCVSCRSCGEAVKCPHCDVSLTYHNNNRLICHYCGYSIPMPDRCPQCGSGYIGCFGTGTEKLEEAARSTFKGARVLRMDMDTTAGKDGHERILSAFANREADILVGTQMIVKGHDFPNVTLVGIMLADMSLFDNDFHSQERTFELLTQAAGRAGRGEKPGSVIIQTYKPEHYAIEYAAAQDYAGFYEKELSYRKLLGYPPFSHMLVIFIASPNAYECDTMSLRLAEYIGKYKEYTVIGPADAVIAKKKDIYRRVIYCKSDTREALVELINLLDGQKPEYTDLKDCVVQYDLEPVNTY